MIKCIQDKICELKGLIDEKINQTEEICTQADEVITQQEEICGCLDAVLGTDGDVCPDCPDANVLKMFQFFGFDEGNGFFNEDEYIMSVTVNGGTPTSQGPSAGTTKSSNYTDAYAAINAEAGWTISVVNDVNEADNGKVEHMVEYAGPAPASLEVVNNHNGDVHTFTVNEDGSCTGVSVDRGGDPINSPTIVVIANRVAEDAAAKEDAAREAEAGEATADTATVNRNIER